MLAAALVQLPAVWVLIGIAVTAIGALPRLTMVAWVALLTFVLLGQLGPLFELPEAVMNVSPFAHIPRLPGGEVSLPPLVWLVVTAAALTAAGLVTLRRRDVPVT